ncbi:MAG: TonB-dependent receptor [Rhodoferax sp.]|nr:TonB-dependent receptor [Rhodoferax sp.]
MTSQLKNNRSRAAFVLRPCAHATALSLAMLAGQAAFAQSEPSQTLQRVEVTGSSIKRLSDENALPVQTITREEILKSGATTAAEIVKSISAASAPLSDGASITDGTSGQRGFNGVNLRGIGVSSTLVLLNGRRLANFATPGDNAGVDLNNIPSGAIQRVEVLKDGASAIYGTDAIGGVINFITRKDYQGFDASASMSDTQKGGASKRTASVSAGFGDLSTNGFNVFGVVDVQKLGALRSTQRDWIAERALATTLPALMSSNTYPANVDINSSQRAKLIAAGLLPAGSTASRVNPSSPGCNPPATVYAPSGPGGKAGCSYDYMQDTEIYPASDKVGFLGRATVQLGVDHQFYLELMQSKAETEYVLSPNPLRVRNLPTSVLPTAYANALGAGTFGGIRWRMKEAGNRTNEVTSLGQRVVAGANGVFGSWDYDVALTRAENTTTDKYVNGYTLFDKIDAGIRSGIINPFGASSQAGKDYINAAKINDEARKSKGVTEGIDGKFTTTIGKLAGGDVAFAIGGETRRETTSFTPSALLLSNNIAGDRDSSGTFGGLSASSDSRTVTGVFAEVVAPVTQELELQFAVRSDDYAGVGTTTNPKIGAKWQPSKTVLFRGSAGTGFRAPSLYDLKGATTYGTASSFITDAYCVNNNIDTIDFCTDQWPVERRSNPNLKPEKSTQFSLGTVLEVSKNFTFGVDYWNIEKTDVISTVGEQLITDNYAKYNGTLIQRDADGFISNIILQKDNQGSLKTSGLDLNFDWRGDASANGRFTASLNGTMIFNYDRQFGKDTAYVSNLGAFVNDQVIQKWRHKLSLGWDIGDLGLTLSNTYLSGYRDQNTTYDPVANKLLPSRDVEPYSLWDMTGSYALSKSLKLRAGILNLLDTAPPFSNQAYYFLAGFDPTYSDPRGRSGYVSVNYSFK